MLLNCGVGEDSWPERRSNQSILKEVSPEYSLEGLMKLWYFDHLMQKAGSLEKTLMLIKIEGRRRRGWQRMRWLDGLTNSMDLSWSNFWEIVKNRAAWCGTVHEFTESQTELSAWTTGYFYPDHFQNPNADSFEKTLMLGKIEGGRRRGQQRMRWLDGITNSIDMSLSKLW